MLQSLAALALLGSVVAQLPELLVYTRTTGYYHESIPAAVQAITELGQGLFNTTAINDSAFFDSSDNLLQYQGIVFLST